MPRSKSSKRWLQEHFDDVYVKKAQAEGYRSRAVYKLKEVDDKHHLLKPGMTVVDLGAAPGGWSQIAAKRVGATVAKGREIPLPLLQINETADQRPDAPGIDVVPDELQKSTRQESIRGWPASAG